MEAVRQAVRRGVPGAIVATSLMLASCSGGAPGGAEPPKEDVPAPAASTEPAPQTDGTCPKGKVRRIQIKRVLRHIRKLSALGPRVRASRQEGDAARYVKKILESFGYEARLQRFSLPEGRSRNVVATWPGGIAHPFVIGAHIDSVPGSPGANDNASGTAMMLEAARSVAGTRRACSIAFVGFGAEEYGPDRTHHRGSDHYVAQMSKRAARRAPGMASVDMIADGRPLLVATAGIGPGGLADMVQRYLEKADIDSERRTICDCSDMGPFEIKGIPAFLLWSGTEPDYHSPSDVPANLSKPDLRRTARAVEAVLDHIRRPWLRRLRDR